MDTSVSSRQRLFSEIISERRRRYVVETRMAPLAVVENFDVLLDRRCRVGPCGVPLMMNHFVLQAAPEAFHRRVVVAVPLARHGCTHAELSDQFSIVVGAVLGGFNRSSQHLLSRRCLWDGQQDGCIS